MKNIYRILLLSFCLLGFLQYGFSREWPVKNNKSTEEIKSVAAGCEPGSAFKYLNINNVRTIIYSYGNGWFVENAEYEIPKGSKKMSMFSMSLWIGGIDKNNNLKLAAYKYGQGPNINPSHTHNDFWPGPLTTDGTAAVDAQTCAKYDKIYQMTREEVQQFIAASEAPDDFPDYVIPRSILEWPAKGDRSQGQAYYLAPFFDKDGDGVYNPSQGDYPYYDFANKLCPRYLKPGEKIARAKLRNGEVDDTLGILVDQVLKGDQTLWNVFNDKGNIHSETQGEPIGLEIRAQAFAFATNDEINNMTFYSYEIINRSTYTLDGTYFSQWVDPDLGYAKDDFVGCDVVRGLGYCYNGKPIDGTGQVEAYGSNPPAIGVDFFQGPYMDKDGRDNPRFTGTLASCDALLSSSFEADQMAINGVNFGDGIPDNERFGMRRFVYHNNQGVPAYMQDPRYAPEYYNMLKGIWIDGQKMKYGGNAHPPSSYGPECDFMFPGTSDLCDWGVRRQPYGGPKDWTEQLAGNAPDDRRFMQSAGPFTLEPGACNYITVGIPWARAATGGPWASVELLKAVDDKCQKLFDNCFAVLNGPNAPDLTIQEMDKQVIIYISNRKTNDGGNNYQEKYVEFDPNIPNPDNLPHNKRNDSLYRFEGYQIFQCKDATVSASDIDDPNKVRLVYQCDVKNAASKLVNWTYNADLGGNVGQIMVTGANKGIEHTVIIKEDKFATDNPRLVNHKQYYYLAVSYAYNNFRPYSPDSINKGQMTPYLRGRNNIKTYTAIPHINLGDVSNAGYGDGPVITRIEGQGNGGMKLELSDETVAEILSKPLADSATNKLGDPDYPIAYHPVYKAGAGPLKVKVIDPLNVVAGEYILKFDSMQKMPSISPYTNKEIMFGNWTLIDKNTGRSYRGDTTTIYPYEQLFLDLGLALQINQVPFPGDSLATAMLKYEGNALIEAPAAIYEDSTKRWLGGIADNDLPGDVENWIRSGTYRGDVSPNNDYDMSDYNPLDPNKDYAKIQGGTWAPYVLAAKTDDIEGIGPVKLKNLAFSNLSTIASVDIVMTPDKSKWTRCPVVEMCNIKSLAEGGVARFELRAHASVNADGDTGVVSTDPLKNSNYLGSMSMGWFPGYAINLETGERLNIVFGENSWMVGNNGRDMKFNPTSVEFDAMGTPIFGGMHYVYIMGSSIIKVGSTVTLDFPAYDGGVYWSKPHGGLAGSSYGRYKWFPCMYVGIPMAVPGKEDLWLSNDCKIKIRISKPYQRYYSTPLPSDYVNNQENKSWPMYSFNTASIATEKQSTDKFVSQLDLINVVPNPYYAYDDYERNQLDNRIKIVNLPPKCTVTIFNVNGTVIRQFDVDKSGIPYPRTSTDGINTEPKTSIDWDLKNYAGIPVAGGVYLIHVKSDQYGERTIKWFGILRPTDLNSY
ncbi:MAG: hypothetical protein ACM3N9_01950 [Syntrophothermus sp.]